MELSICALNIDRVGEFIHSLQNLFGVEGFQSKKTYSGSPSTHQKDDKKCHEKGFAKRDGSSRSSESGHYLERSSSYESNEEKANEDRITEPVKMETATESVNVQKLINSIESKKTREQEHLWRAGAQMNPMPKRKSFILTKDDQTDEINQPQQSGLGEDCVDVQADDLVNTLENQQERSKYQEQMQNKEEDKSNDAASCPLHIDPQKTPEPKGKIHHTNFVVCRTCTILICRC